MHSDRPYQVSCNFNFQTISMWTDVCSSFIFPVQVNLGANPKQQEIAYFIALFERVLDLIWVGTLI